MRVTTADLWEVRPGRVVAWSVDGGPAGAEVPLSANQRNHLAAAADEPSVWLAAAFDVPGPLDEDALERAFRDLVVRHPTLQVGTGPGPVGRRHDPAVATWRQRTVDGPTGPALRALLDAGCTPHGYPAFAPLAVVRPDVSTVVLGLDHLHADAHSVAVVAEDLHRAYAARRSGTAPWWEPAASFLDHTVRAWVAADDPRLRAWHDFLAGGLPGFPLPLGVAPGEREAQSTRVVRLAGRRTTDALEVEARASGASTYALVLGRYAEALAALGAPGRLPLLVPVGGRRTPEERRAVGWFAATVPLVVTAGASAAEVARDLRAAVALADVPLDQVLATLPVPLVRDRGDVFMVSWLDYRRLPGRGLPGAHHVSAATRADDLQAWLSRTDDGLWLRVRHPDTPTAHATVKAVEESWRARLTPRAAAPEPARRGA